MPLPVEVETPVRFDERVTITTAEEGKVTVRMVDRINVDDVFVHLVNRNLYRLSVGADAGTDVPVLFKEFLLKERFTAGQG
jgi:hypothetical protein